MDWIKIFENKEVAQSKISENKPQLLIVKGKRICLVLRQGSLFAVDDKCTHNGGELSKGTINYVGEVICPWHGYRFNLKTGRECEGRSGDIANYPIREDESGIFIGL